MPAISGVEHRLDLRLEDRAEAGDPGGDPQLASVLFAPDAMPLSCGATTPTAVDASAGVARPIPMPDRIWPGSGAVHPDKSDRFPISSSPTVTNASRPVRLSLGLSAHVSVSVRFLVAPTRDIGPSSADEAARREF